jgi:glycerophosphoryl diester phosphodiesterase
MDINSLKFPICIAHRGIKELYPENTLASFQAALNNHAQMIELDVALSKDRQLIVIHDETLDRTTSGSGRINEKSFEALRKLDAGSWFDPMFKGEHIPTLQEVIELVTKQAVLNIEIKKEYFEESDPADAIEKQVLNHIRENKLLEHSVVSSFQIKYLQRLRQLEPDINLAYISLEPVDHTRLDACLKLGVLSWNAWHETLDKSQVDLLHEAGVKVLSFTIQTMAEYEKVIALGVDGIFADNYPRFQPLLST